MKITSEYIQRHNETYLSPHRKQWQALTEQYPGLKEQLSALQQFQIAIPSWALGTGGTRFGRFSGAGEPRTLNEKIEDVGLLHALNRSSGAISLHIPWDIPDQTNAIRDYAASYGLRFDAMNSNTFQDQPGQPLSYKFGSLHHVDNKVRRQAIRHNLEVIDYGKALGSSALTVWLSDGSSYPGQLSFRGAFERTLESLQEIYAALPTHWKLLVEYKAYEPHFYSMTVGDWGQSYLYASKLGPQAYTLVDLGHHLPNANIEQIVSLLLMERKLGGFHFNDSKYGDDDLTVGSIRPYQLFLIFVEMIEGVEANGMDHAKDISWMIDASHNLKDPLEDLLQSVEAILLAYAQALRVDRKALRAAREENDVVRCQEILQKAFRTDWRPWVAEARLQSGGALQPLAFFRDHGLRKQLIQVRGSGTQATGL